MSENTSIFCPNCKSDNVSIARDFKSTRHCQKCSYSWLPVNNKFEEVSKCSNVTQNSLHEVVEEWQGVWMNQKQNNEADYQNYFHRALGVDANMRYSLSQMMFEHVQPLNAKIAKLTEALTDARDVIFGQANYHALENQPAIAMLLHDKSNQLTKALKSCEQYDEKTLENL